ncbi:hypothetical protein CI610_02748 [invertebrate metagenome]|uniref:Uncharacterized protein n=1 Tax=invertebrate metagenome TaxID=1711999 RepID=A0A2H9T540_9ZZZZ
MIYLKWIHTYMWPYTFFVYGVWYERPKVYIIYFVFQWIFLKFDTLYIGVGNNSSAILPDHFFHVFPYICYYFLLK